MAQTIQWYPGHMAKAKRQFQEKLKLVDIVLELVDARIPYSSQNPDIDQIVGDKPRIRLMMKKDIADPNISSQWLNYFRQRELPTLLVNANDQKDLAELIAVMQEVLEPLQVQRRRKGMKDRAIRAVMVGIPNVGKSTVINRFAGRSVAQVGNRPGVTKAQQWIKYKNKIELLDTPGILWPKFDDDRIGYRLALTGAIKDTLFHSDDVALFGMQYIEKYYPGIIAQRYHFEPSWEELDYPDQLIDIAHYRGFQDDYLQAAELFITEFRRGQLGRISLERPSDVNE